MISNIFKYFNSLKLLRNEDEINRLGYVNWYD